MEAEPKFATVKIEAGDYLLPANDKIHLWRIKKGHIINITENGSEVETPAWELYRWTRWLRGDENDGDRISNSIFDWNCWEFEESTITKKECLVRSAELIPGE